MWSSSTMPNGLWSRLTRTFPPPGIALKALQKVHPGKIRTINPITDTCRRPDIWRTGARGAGRPKDGQELRNPQEIDQSELREDIARF
jgi:hypothetical protein